MSRSTRRIPSRRPPSVSSRDSEPVKAKGKASTPSPKRNVNRRSRPTPDPAPSGATSTSQAGRRGRKSQAPIANESPKAGAASAPSAMRARGGFRQLREIVRGSRFPKVVGTADVILAATLVALLFFGVVMVYSASATMAARTMGSGYHYLIRQTIYACGGLMVMLVLARIDYHHYRAPYVTYPILMGSLALLLVVALGGGHTVGGAARWIDLKIIRVQPAEIAKLAIIFYLAYSLAKKREQVRDFKIGFLPHMIVAGVFMLLCLKQPDFGSAVMIGLLTVILLFTAGTRLNYILGSALIAAPIVYMLITGSAYRMRRIRAFLNPFDDRAGIGYQTAESLISFAQGGTWGVGLGESLQKLFFLPEAHTDFISAIVGEELGLVGVTGLILAFSMITYRGLRTAFNAADDYGTYLATGITLFVGLQAFTNLSVALALLPTKGLTLPFISYGGSSLLVNSAAVGLLLNVSRPRAVQPLREDDDAPEAGPSTKNDPPKKRRARRNRGPRTREGGAPGLVTARAGTNGSIL